MTGEIEQPGVTNYERVEVAPAAGGDDEVLLPEDTDLDSPPENDDEPEEGAEVDPENDPADESPDGKPEGIVTPTEPITPAAALAPAAPATPEPSNKHGLKRGPSESTTEFARRLEIADLRSQLREKRSGEILGNIAPPSATPGSLPPLPVASDEEKAVLEKYGAGPVAALKEVFPILAKEMGFVRKEEIAGDAYTRDVQGQLDAFTASHPEYLPENDPGGETWKAFKTEFAQYRPPANAKDFARLFEKVHQNVFGITSGGATLPRIEAARATVRTAGHAGASGPTAPSRQARSSAAGSGLRLDALKGFTDEEKQAIISRAGE